MHAHTHMDTHTHMGTHIHGHIHMDTHTHTRPHPRTMDPGLWIYRYTDWETLRWGNTGYRENVFIFEKHIHDLEESLIQSGRIERTCVSSWCFSIFSGLSVMSMHYISNQKQGIIRKSQTQAPGAVLGTVVAPCSLCPASHEHTALYAGNPSVT